VPYWDFDVPNKATAPRDTSAAAVVASALLELSGFESDAAAKQRDIDNARAILTSLSSPTYAPRNAAFAAMLQHGSQHVPKGWADTGIMFGDYYFTEALGRYGPDLTHVASRPYIGAGVLANTPANLGRWIRHPQSVKPGSRMPDVRLSDAQWAAIGTYLRGLR